MLTTDSIKKIVKDKYGEIARRSEQNQACGCSSTDEVTFSDDYLKLNGYVPDADLGLGCGLPTEFALIKKGDTVIDLGAGAGNDCFVARAETGESGRVIGVDMTENMIAKARKNAKKLGYANVEFRLGDIENPPVEDNLADVVVSNCVLNLVPDKNKAFTETFRVLKPGGHFSVSNIVTTGEMPPNLREVAAVYTGCVAGALTKEAYLKNIEQAGFEDIKIENQKEIKLDEELLINFLSDEEVAEFRNSKISIFSITVYAKKPST